MIDAYSYEGSDASSYRRKASGVPLGDTTNVDASNAHVYQSATFIRYSKLQKGGDKDMDVGIV
jgi:hypothetical protein